MDVVSSKKLQLAKLKRSLKTQLNSCFRADELTSAPTPKQLELFRDELHSIFYVLGSNRSGKTSVGSREVAWWFQNSHPHKKRRKEWGDGPLKILVMAQTDKNAENEIWGSKIKPLLTAGEYKEHRQGNSLQRVDNLVNGNVMIFFSHHNAAQARKAVQGFTGQIVWLDEMPEASSLVAELITRIADSNGYFFATFTPLVENEAIRKIVDAASGKAIKVTLTLFDNPALQDRLDEVVEAIRNACSTEAEANARLYGEWYYSNLKVFSYQPDRHMRPLPATYTPLWRHCAIVDPAASGLAGLTVWAEDPKPFVGEPRWYCVKASYVDGDAAFEQVEKIEQEIRGLAVVLRGCDCNPAGFYKEANSVRRKLRYIPYTDKKDHKDESIQDFNTFLVSGEGVLTPGAELLEEELLSCKRNESTGRIMKESRFHVADTARYFVQLKPKPAKETHEHLTGSARVRQQWKERKAAEATKQAQVLARKGRRRWKLSRQAS